MSGIAQRYQRQFLLLLPMQRLITILLTILLKGYVCFFRLLFSVALQLFSYLHHFFEKLVSYSIRSNDVLLALCFSDRFEESYNLIS